MTIRFLLAATLSIALANAQDTVKFQYPVEPFRSTQGVSGTFGEYRSTSAAGHFHNGTDLPKADGSPVYPSMTGVVTSIDNASGSNNSLRVRSGVGSLFKQITYVHIVPNPALVVGDSVYAGISIVGTIYSGTGHVHMTERELSSSMTSLGVEINSIRPEGGLTPYTDTWPPVINAASLTFWMNGTTQPLLANALSGEVDIVVRIDEKNSASTSSAYNNNGTFIAEYRIFNATGDTVKFLPPDNGIRYRFNRKPFDAQVGMVYDKNRSSTTDHFYIVTNGDGAMTVSATRNIADRSFDTRLLPEGNYLLEIAAEDTRGNRSSQRFPITIVRSDRTPPARVKLRSASVAKPMPVTQSANTLWPGGMAAVAWEANTEPDLYGYRVYCSTDSITWWLEADEGRLGKTAVIWADGSGRLLDTLYRNFTSPQKAYFYVTAVDTATPGNESIPSQIFQVRYDPVQQSVRIIDGFERWGGSGSWQQPAHPFVSQWASAIESLHVAAISKKSWRIDGENNLHDYPLGLYFLFGDQSTAHRTFLPDEQTRVRNFLQGFSFPPERRTLKSKLFVSGSEVGWDLGRTHSATQPGDLAFYNQVLKASYVSDGDASMNTVTGAPGTVFEGFSARIGAVYPEDFPDDIDPVNGSAPLLYYNTVRGTGMQRIAGVGFRVLNPNDATEVTDGMMYVSFPVETIASDALKKEFFDRVRKYLGLDKRLNWVSNNTERTADVPREFRLEQNYPNPFNPSTRIRFSVPNETRIMLTVFDALGREVAVLKAGITPAGVYETTWNAAFLPSGIYFCRLSWPGSVQTIKLVLTK